MRESNETILEYLQRRLNDCKGDWPKIAAETKLPYDTIAKTAQGKRPNPTLATAQPLLDYFDRIDAKIDALVESARGGPTKAPA